MGCKNILENLSAYLDQELEETENTTIKQHLKQCSSCRAEHDKLLMVRHCLQDLAHQPAPDGFLFRLNDRIEKSPATWWQKAGRSLEKALEAIPLRTMTAAAGVILAVAVIFAGIDSYQLPDNSITHRSSEMETYSGPEMLTSATEALPVEFASTNPSTVDNNLYLDTPNELLLTVIKNDPKYQSSKVLPHPRGQGVLVNTGEKLLEITMDPAEFPIIQAYLEQQGGKVPQTLHKARMQFPIYVRVHPSPSAPLENRRPDLHHVNHTMP